MATINYAAKEISVKIVYYGPGLSGKTTNLQIIHRKIPRGTRSDMVSLATETDRTLFFDFLPLDLGKIRGFTAKFQLYTVPGQVYYNATRKLVLRGVDGIVFVADSAADKMDENLESLNNMEENLAEYGYKKENIPIILQFNKRDLSNALPINYINQKINSDGFPYREAIAQKGEGVFESLKLIGKLVIDQLNQKYASKKRPGDSKPSQITAPATAKESGPPPVQVTRPADKQGTQRIPIKPLASKPVVEPTTPPPPPVPPKPVIKEKPKQAPQAPQFQPPPPQGKPFAPQPKPPAPQFEGAVNQVPPPPPVAPPQMPKKETAQPDLSHFPETPPKQEQHPQQQNSQSPYSFNTIDLEPMPADPMSLPINALSTEEEYSNLETEINHYYEKLKRELPEQIKPDDFGSQKPQGQMPQQQNSAPPSGGQAFIPPKPEARPQMRMPAERPLDLEDELMEEDKQKSKKKFFGKFFNRGSL